MIDNYEQRKARLAELEEAKKATQHEIDQLNAELNAPYITYYEAASKKIGGDAKGFSGLSARGLDGIRAGVDAVLAEAEKRHRRYCDTQQDHIEELTKANAVLDTAHQTAIAERDAARRELRNRQIDGITKDLLEPYQSKLVAEARQVYWTEVGEPEHLAQRPSDKSFAAWRKVVGLIWREAMK